MDELDDDWADWAEPSVSPQDMMCLLTDNPRRLMDQPWRRMYEQAEQARRGPGYGGMEYLTCPF